MILIKPIPILSDNYVWVMVNTLQRCALVVDPGDARPVIDYLSHHDLTLSAVFITHHHGDHTQGLFDLLEHHAVPVFGSTRKIRHITHQVSAPQTIFLESFPVFQILDIPGHTLDHIAYYSEEILFCGDTLFSGGCGRIFEGTPKQMYASLQKIAALPDDTLIYCAHEYTLKNLLFARLVEPGNTTIQQRLEHVRLLIQKNKPSLPSCLIDEKEINPFLRCTSPEVIQQVEHHAGRHLSNAIEVFTELRAWKNNF